MADPPATHPRISRNSRRRNAGPTTFHQRSTKSPSPSGIDTERPLRATFTITAPATASYRPASCASRTARALVADLRRLPVDFGIGVSAGPVFAGNIGAENRYEYTVVGDAVNEAARLADRAKDFEERVLCSAAAIDRADETERRSWSVQGSEMLRGRSRLTQISAPARGGLGVPAGDSAVDDQMGARDERRPG